MSADNTLIETVMIICIPGLINKNLTVPQECQFGEQVINIPLTTYHIMKICGITLNSYGVPPLKVKTLFDQGETFLKIFVSPSKVGDKISSLINEKHKEVIEFFSQSEQKSIVINVDYIIDINKIKGEMTNRICELTNTSNEEGDFRIRYNHIKKKTEVEIIPHTSHVYVFSLESTREQIKKIVCDPEYALRRESNANIIFDVLSSDQKSVDIDSVLKELRQHYKVIKFYESKPDEENLYTIKIFDKITTTRSTVEGLENAIFKKTGIRVKGFIHEDFKLRYNSEKEIVDIPPMPVQEDDGRLSVCSELLRTSSPSKTSWTDIVRGSSVSPIFCKSPLTKSRDWNDHFQETEDENREESENALKFDNKVERSDFIVKPSVFVEQVLTTNESTDSEPIKTTDESTVTEPIKTKNETKTDKKKKFTDMTVEEVAEKICNIGENYKAYREIFIANAFDGEFLSKQEVEYLKKEFIDLGIRSIHATRIVHGIGQWLVEQ